MPSPPIYTLAPLRLNHPLRRYLESGHTIHTNSLIAISKSILAIVFFSPQRGSFVASVCVPRYTIVGHPVAVFRSWLATALVYLSPKRRCLIPQ